MERPDHDNPDLRRSELQLSAELDGIIITGRVDNYKLRFLDYGDLKDWKSIGDNGLQYIISDGAKEDHVWQTNIYAWLLRKNGYRVDTIEIAYLSFMQVVKTGTKTGFHEYLASPPAKTGRRRNMAGRNSLKSTAPGSANGTALMQFRTYLSTTRRPSRTSSGQKPVNCTLHSPPAPSPDSPWQKS